MYYKIIEKEDESAEIKVKQSTALQFALPVQFSERGIPYSPYVKNRICNASVCLLNIGRITVAVGYSVF